MHWATAAQEIGEIGDFTSVELDLVLNEDVRRARRCRRRKPSGDSRMTPGEVGCPGQKAARLPPCLEASSGWRGSAGGVIPFGPIVPGAAIPPPEHLRQLRHPLQEHGPRGEHSLH
jgi:hypothetical protein